MSTSSLVRLYLNRVPGVRTQDIRVAVHISALPGSIPEVDV